VVLACVLGVTTGTETAQGGDGITGRWLTEDRKGVVDIAPCGASICGRLDWIYQPMRHGAPTEDEENPNPALRNRRLCGVIMLYDFHRDPADPRHWEGGYIYDPESGHTYHAEITVVDSEHLRLRGYVMVPLLGESQTWTRPVTNHPKCQAA
jgi:uncharacterized protein (DUF2147 family)